MSLAAQTLSSCVADALEFLNDDMKIEEFRSCEARLKYIKIVDRLFDVLNYRSPWAKGFKVPLKLSNEEIWRAFLMETIQYLVKCTDVSDRPLWLTPRSILDSLYLPICCVEFLTTLKQKN